LYDVDWPYERMKHQKDGTDGRKGQSRKGGAYHNLVVNESGSGEVDCNRANAAKAVNS